MNGFILVAALVVGTWNGNWFPSGRAEHRAHPEVEAATSRAAAAMLAAGLKAVDPDGTNDVVLCLNEMRGPRAVSNLVEQIGRPSLRIAAVSGYRRRDRFDMQQDAIVTTLPVVEKGWARWRSAKEFTPPRGFAYAALDLGMVTTTVYAVHLKSDYGAGRNEQLLEVNRRKRATAMAQLVGELPKDGAVVVMGDFNADCWGKAAAKETLFVSLKEAGLTNLLAALPPGERYTHPNRRYGNSTLDYVFCRGLSAVGRPMTMPNEGLSDHFAVFAMLQVEER